MELLKLFALFNFESFCLMFDKTDKSKDHFADRPIVIIDFERFFTLTEIISERGSSFYRPASFFFLCLRLKRFSWVLIPRPTRGPNALFFLLLGHRIIDNLHLHVIRRRKLVTGNSFYLLGALRRSFCQIKRFYTTSTLYLVRAWKVSIQVLT